MKNNRANPNRNPNANRNPKGVLLARFLPGKWSGGGGTGGMFGSGLTQAVKCETKPECEH